MPIMKIGHGYDVHAFGSGSYITIGGVNIPCDMSIIAHSDGDVLIHALCDAIFGALGLGDIGRHFPDSDDVNKNRDSRDFLCEALSQMKEQQYRLGNADITIIAQTPRMAKHTEKMVKVLAADLQCNEHAINIKATTTESLGYIGREEGIATHAVVLLEKIS
ncbi:MAG: 2-C-methyl-D-erythritol 2,4-cyclodiphosphate synthase [Gammaproteobacteria bacterium]|jgi:2-C-methyl-D-erythritol 2,4-cyclodiphosphate synthase